MSITVRTNDPVPTTESETKPVAQAQAPAAEIAQASGAEDQVAEETEAEAEAQDADVEGDESEAQADEESEKGKRKSGLQKKFDKMTKQKAELRKEVDYWREVALKSQSKTDAKPESTQTQETAQAKANDGKPKADDFNTHEEWVEAVADWKLETKLKELKAKEQAEKLKEEVSEKERGYLEKLETFRAEHADFDELVEEIGEVPMSLTVQQLILKHGPALTYELIQDPKEYQRLNKLSAIDAAEEIGAIVARIKSSSAATAETKEIKTTKAPKPLKTVGAGGSGVKKTIFDETLSQAEYERLRMEQKRAKSA